MSNSSFFGDLGSASMCTRFLRYGQRKKECLAADDRNVKANTNSSSSSGLVWLLYAGIFSTSTPFSYFPFMMMMVKNLGRLFYISAKSRWIFFSEGWPLAWQSCGKLACLGACIAKMPVDV